MASIYYTKRLKNRTAPTRLPRDRPKTFKSIEAAEAWAKIQKLKKYHLNNLRFENSKDVKIQVIEDLG